MSQTMSHPSLPSFPSFPSLASVRFKSFSKTLISRVCTVLHVNKKYFSSRYGGTSSTSPTPTSRPEANPNVAAAADQNPKSNPVNRFHPEILWKLPRFATHRSPIDLIDLDRAQTTHHQDQSTSDRFLKLPSEARIQTHSVYKKTHCSDCRHSLHNGNASQHSRDTIIVSKPAHQHTRTQTHILLILLILKSCLKNRWLHHRKTPEPHAPQAAFMARCPGP
jgi:hypothetical protein